MEKKTTEQIVEDINYNNGILWNKVLPPESDEWNVEWVRVDDVIKIITPPKEIDEFETLEEAYDFMVTMLNNVIDELSQSNPSCSSVPKSDNSEEGRDILQRSK